MNRGELWVGSGPGFAGKPRPVLVVQDDALSGFRTRAVCLVTSNDDPHFENRVRIEPSAVNGFGHTSWVMTDKIFSFRKDQFTVRMGRLTDGEMEKVSEQLRKVLGL